jgi:hypothetical protein
MDRYGVQNRFQLGLMIGAYAETQIPRPDAGEADDEQA